MIGSTPTTDAAGDLGRRRFLVLAVCCASMLVVVMDISIVNVALPAIRRDLHASVSGLQWTVDAYTLVLAGFLVLAGSTADRIGRRRVFRVGLAAFGLGSLLCGLAPSIGGLIVVLSPYVGRLVGRRGPRQPLLLAGTALALGGGASTWLTPATPLPAVLAIYLLFGVFLCAVNPPINNTAVSGMPVSMTAVAASLASTGRHTGTTLGVAIAGTVVGSTLGRGGTAFTSVAHGVWWLVVGLGVGILVLGLFSTGRWALGTARRAAVLFGDEAEAVAHGGNELRAAATRP